jgi:hypothetical protein
LLDGPGESGYGLSPVGGRPERFVSRPRSRRPSALAARVAVAAAGVLAFVLVAVPVASASNNVNGDKKKIVQLEAQIQAAGNYAQGLVSAYDVELGKEQQVRDALVATGHRIASDQSATERAARRLRALAVDAYVYAGSSTGVAALIGVPSTLSAEASVYATLAGGKLQSASTTYLIDIHALTGARSKLGQEQASIHAVMHRLIPDQHSAYAAIAREQELLYQTKGQLKAALVAMFRAHQAAVREQQEEDALAKRTVVVSASQALPAPTATPSSQASTAPAGYANPLRGVSGLTPERIDQGVDYNGIGPVFAIGDGVVLSTVNGGWPGGTFITYKLESGPAAGLVVYVAEDLVPRVYIGEQVTPSTVVGDMYAGWSGIETGWADGSLGDTMAMVAGQFAGWNSTAYGWNFDQLLVSLGAPSGILQNNPASGAVPGGWPTW